MEADNSNNTRCKYGKIDFKLTREKESSLLKSTYEFPVPRIKKGGYVNQAVH